MDILFTLPGIIDCVEVGSEIELAITWCSDFLPDELDEFQKTVIRKHLEFIVRFNDGNIFDEEREEKRYHELMKRFE